MTNEIEDLELDEDWNECEPIITRYKDAHNRKKKQKEEKKNEK